jgi:CPA1 family monovalent cation:H+ antiporter
LQSAAFFLVGLEMPRVLDAMPTDQIPTLIVAIPVVFVTLVVIRFAFVFLMALVSGQWSDSRGWLVAAWAGTRGPISALAAFTVPVATDAGDRIPYRDLVISITFGVVIISLLLAPTIAWLARAVHLPKDDDASTERRVHLALARAALNRLEEIEEEGERKNSPVPASVIGPLRSRAQQRLERASVVSQRESVPRHPTGARELAVEMMRSEQEELLRLRDREGLPDEIVRHMQHEIDVRIRALGA